MIRSTINQSIKTIGRKGIIGQSIETYETAVGATDAVTETEWVENGGTGSPVYSNAHWDGSAVTP